MLPVYQDSGRAKFSVGPVPQKSILKSSTWQRTYILCMELCLSPSFQQLVTSCAGEPFEAQLCIVQNRPALRTSNANAPCLNWFCPKKYRAAWELLEKTLCIDLGSDLLPWASATGLNTTVCALAGLPFQGCRRSCSKLFACPAGPMCVTQHGQRLWAQCRHYQMFAVKNTSSACRLHIRHHIQQILASVIH